MVGFLFGLILVSAFHLNPQFVGVIFPKLPTPVKSVERLLINCNPNVTQKRHINAVSVRLELTGDVISACNVKPVEGCRLVNSVDSNACAVSFYIITESWHIVIE